MILKKGWTGTTKAKLRNKISFMSRRLKDLIKGFETITEEVNKLEKAQATKDAKIKVARSKSKTKPVKPKSPKKIPLKKIPIKIRAASKKPAKKVVTQKAAPIKVVAKKRVAKKTDISTDFDTAIRIIRRSRKGITVNRLKEKTRFDTKKIANIIYKGKKRGLIKSEQKGIYVKG